MRQKAELRVFLFQGTCQHPGAKEADLTRDQDEDNHPIISHTPPFLSLDVDETELRDGANGAHKSQIDWASLSGCSGGPTVPDRSLAAPSASKMMR